MDVHIYMGHCNPVAFRRLAATYLGIKEHVMFKCVDDLIQRTAITPAEVAQHLMKCGKPEIALQSLIEFMNMKEEEMKQTEGKKDEMEVIKQEVVSCPKKDVEQTVKCNSYDVETGCVYLS